MKIELIKIRTYLKETYLTSNVKRNISHCGINWWDRSLELSDVVDYMYLAKTTTWNPFMLITYIA